MATQGSRLCVSPQADGARTRAGDHAHCLVPVCLSLTHVAQSRTAAHSTRHHCTLQDCMPCDSAHTRDSATNPRTRTADLSFVLLDLAWGARQQRGREAPAVGRDALTLVVRDCKGNEWRGTRCESGGAFVNRDTAQGSLRECDERLAQPTRSRRCGGRRGAEAGGGDLSQPGLLRAHRAQRAQ